MLSKIKKWIRIKVFRRVTVLDILEYADWHRDSGLCWAFRTACFDHKVSYEDFKDKCTKFNRDTALTFKADPDDVYWWPSRDWSGGRKDFLDYLIKYYEQKKPIYLKRRKK